MTFSIQQFLRNGLTGANKLLLDNYLQANDGKFAEITIKINSKPRSIRQNKYWFGMLNKYAVPVFRDYGDNWNEFSIHEYIMNELGYQTVLIKKDGDIFISRMHSSEFNTKEWEEYMDRARAFLAIEHGVYIPLPNEINIKYYEDSHAGD